MFNMLLTCQTFKYQQSCMTIQVLKFENCKVSPQTLRRNFATAQTRKITCSSSNSQSITFFYLIILRDCIFFNFVSVLFGVNLLFSISFLSSSLVGENCMTVAKCQPNVNQLSCNLVLKFMSSLYGTWLPDVNPGVNQLTSK